MLEHVATLQEVETWYSLDDVLDQNDALDAYQAAKRQAEQGAKV